MYLFQKVFTYLVKILLLPPSDCFRLSDELWHEGHTEVLLAYELPLEVDLREPVKNEIRHLIYLVTQHHLFIYANACNL